MVAGDTDAPPGCGSPLENVRVRLREGGCSTGHGYNQLSLNKRKKS